MFELLSEWSKVVNTPAGLIAFTLLLVFLAFIIRSGRVRWLTPVFVVLAAITLIGGFAVLITTNLVNIATPSGNEAPVPQISVEKIDVITHGSGAPATAFDFSNKNTKNGQAKSDPFENDKKLLETDK